MNQPPERPQPLWRRLAARAALIGGLALLVAVVFPTVPREQTFVFRVSDASTVRRLDVSFTREGEQRPESGVTLRYPVAAPATVRHTASLENGRWLLTIGVERELSSGRKETSFERRVTLEGGETVVVLEDSP